MEIKNYEKVLLFFFIKKFFRLVNNSLEYIVSVIYRLKFEKLLNFMIIKKKVKLLNFANH